ncbi:TPC1 [Symbiodinium natans]|uniref:TPC1 protein n=1 Tax=Symbiodinium natans TaxID=878477 RepID=A0A812NHA5_9DINO|nr:TPC1 [Symbiodinium natans]
MPRDRNHDDNESVDSGTDDGFPDLNAEQPWERAVSMGSAVSFSRRGEIIEVESEANSAIRNLAISAGYFQRADSVSADTTTLRGDSALSSRRFYGCAKKLVRSRYFGHFMVVVVLADAVLTATDIDARAAGGQTPPAVIAASSVCLGLYTVELLLQLLVRGTRIIRDWLTKLDVIIIASGYAELLLGMMIDVDFLNTIGIVRILRLSRILRLMQLMRKNRSLKELRKLVTMLATCLKTLVWSFLFCFLVTTGWAMLVVELINPYVLEMQKMEPFDTCPQCVRATSSVMHANLMLFKTVIAGDSWGLIAVPMIEKHPETAIIFVGASLTLVFGVLNLIVAVVVDTFAETRENDVVNLAQEMEFSMEDDQHLLRKIFHRLDTDKNGELTLEELLHGARTDAEFQSRLRVMDIDEVDLQQFFDMIDLDGSGSIEADEFVIPLSRWVHDSKTAPRFIKYNLMRAMAQQDQLLKYSQKNFTDLFEQLQGLALAVEGRAKHSKVHRRPSDSKAQQPCASKGVKFVAFDSEASQASVASKASLPEEIPDAADKHVHNGVGQPCGSLQSQLDHLKADLEASLQAAVKVLDGCIKTVSLPSIPASMNGQDSSPQGSLARTQVGGTFSAVAVPAGSFDVASDKSPGPLITASSTGEIARSNALTSIRTMEV